MVFDRDYDLALTVLLVALCIYYVTWRRLPKTMSARTRHGVLTAVLSIWVMLSGAVIWRLLYFDNNGVFTARNFYTDRCRSASVSRRCRDANTFSSATATSSTGRSSRRGSNGASR
jgi:hypothetical protein